MSKIEWTGRTWNPLVGCTIHSAGCKGCYAMGEAYRLMHNPHPAIRKKFAGTAKMVKGHAIWTGRINFSPEALLAPLRRRVPTTYFVNSMSDLFHAGVHDEKIEMIFAVMAMTPHHTYQVLTKRAGRMRAWMQRFDNPDWLGNLLDTMDALGGRSGLVPEGSSRFSRWPLPNVWLGVSVEDQRAAEERIPDLLNTPAAVRFLSCEPLIGPLNLNHVKFVDREAEGGGREMGWESALNGLRFDLWADDGEDPMKPGFPKLDWVIVGGESGRRARPMHPDWARALRDQCSAAKVPFFFKQWGNWAPRIEWAPGPSRQVAIMLDGERVDDEVAPQDVGGHRFEFVRKGVAGRLLDGVEHNGMPA